MAEINRHISSYVVNSIIIYFIRQLEFVFQIGRFIY